MYSYFDAHSDTMTKMYKGKEAVQWAKIGYLL